EVGEGEDRFVYAARFLEGVSPQLERGAVVLLDERREVGRRRLVISAQHRRACRLQRRRSRQQGRRIDLRQAAEFAFGLFGAPAFLQSLAAIVKRVIAEGGQTRDVLVGEERRGGREIFRLRTHIAAQETRQRRFLGPGKGILHAL